MKKRILNLCLIIFLIFAILISGCTSKKCNYTCCYDNNCVDDNKKTQDVCVFPSTIDSICVNKVTTPDTLRIEEFANNYIINDLKSTDQYYIAKVYMKDDVWYVHALIGDDKHTFIFNDEGFLVDTEAYSWV